MSFRARALAAMVVVALGPLMLFAAGVRDEVGTRLRAERIRRTDDAAETIMRSLARESDGISRRLQAIAAALPDDDRLRLALVGAPSADRQYRVEWAGRAMALAGLDVLQLHDGAGRILSSGHFPNDFDRIETPSATPEPADSPSLAEFRTAEGPVLALARRVELQVGGSPFVLAGGIRMDEELLRRFGAHRDLEVQMAMPGDTGRADDSRIAAREVNLPLQRPHGAPGRSHATLRIFATGDELAALRRGIDRWFSSAVVLVAAGALVLGVWLSARLVRPLARLASAAGEIGLAGGERFPAAERDDEIGLLARRLTSMAHRLRRGAEALREAERRATVGEMARQVNHDVKNGLVPIRNVLRHLGEVQERTPGELSAVFAERRGTLEASVSYLDELARRYARLAPRSAGTPVDVAAVAMQVVSAARDGGAPVGFARTAGDLPVLETDPVALRRVLDNLVRNAIESLPTNGGTVEVRVTPCDGGIRLTVADTGCGMSRAELGRAFTDFHSTKRDGTGLGLSVVRRLAGDLGARLHVESTPGRGTTVALDLPVSHPPATVHTSVRDSAALLHPDLR